MSTVTGRRSVRRPPAPRDGRTDRLARLRQMAADHEIALLLDRRADRSTNPALADVLRERAGLRRHRAERIRLELCSHPLAVAAAPELVPQT